MREDKQTTKVRIVYDASTKSTGTALNDCLHAGPSLLSEIPDVLVRFRYYRVAWAAVTEKAFLMVQIKEADRDVLRFLWINDTDNENPNTVVKRFNRVVCGVTSSPFLLKKILGLNWNMDRDTFVFQFDWLVEFANELPINKRTVLKVVAKLFDPLGLISPLCIPIETLFQDLCKLKIGWDDPLDEELSLRYSQWLSDLLKCIPIQRCYLQDESVISLELHGFRDGSEVAYAAAVYLRAETSQVNSTGAQSREEFQNWNAW